MQQQDRYIRFDRALKRQLCLKDNLGILEGLLTVLLGEEIKIIKLWKYESNLQAIYEKPNRVGIKAKNSKGEIIIVEVQSTSDSHSSFSKEIPCHSLPTHPSLFHREQ